MTAEPIEKGGATSDLQHSARSFVEDAGQRYSVEAAFQAFLDASGQAIFCVSVLRNPLSLDRPTLALSLLRRYLEGAHFEGMEEIHRRDLLRRFESAFGLGSHCGCVN